MGALEREVTKARENLARSGVFVAPASGPKGIPIWAQGAALIDCGSGYVEVGWAIMPQDEAMLSISCPPGQLEVAGAAKLHTSRPINSATDTTSPSSWYRTLPGRMWPTSPHRVLSPGRI